MGLGISDYLTIYFEQFAAQLSGFFMGKKMANTQETLGLAVDEFVADTERVNTFVNGGIDDDYIAEDGSTVPSIRKYLHLLNGVPDVAEVLDVLTSPRAHYSPNKRLDVLFGVLRQNPTDMTRWEFLDDTAHTPEGFDTTYPLNTPTGTVLSPRGAGATLRINFKRYTDVAKNGGTTDNTYDRVGVGLVCADEVLAQQWGIKLGAQVLRNAMIINGSMSKTMKMRIYWSGSAWVVTQDSKQPFSNVTTSYDGATGTLTVNHGWLCGDDLRVDFNSRAGLVTLGAEPVYNSCTDTSFTVRFAKTDLANGLKTFITGAPTTAMSFNAAKTYNGAVYFDGTSGFDAIPWKTTDAGNIWVFAIMQRAGSGD